MSAPPIRLPRRSGTRCNETDLSLPIILAANGSLMDGMHRIAKAWVLGLKEIQVVRFPVTPEADERVPKNAGATL
jgi:nitrogen fixation protein